MYSLLRRQNQDTWFFCSGKHNVFLKDQSKAASGMKKLEQRVLTCSGKKIMRLFEFFMGRLRLPQTVARELKGERSQEGEERNCKMVVPGGLDEKRPEMDAE